MFENFCLLELRWRFVCVLRGLRKKLLGENPFPIVRIGATLFYREA
jgi:hypothetical protein